jgi:hypothetical protein
MNFSLVLLFEGSSDLGPVPIFRVVDPELNHLATERAIANAVHKASSLKLVDDEAYAEASSELDRLRAVLAAV